MPTTIELEDIPEDLFRYLQRSADTNGRSLNSEIIASLEFLLLPKKTTAIQHLAAVRAARARLPKDVFSHDDVDQLKRVGRM
jgi:antitoxin FitA